jgi:hypothetical protein
MLDFYRQLPSGDRQFVILPGLAHSVVSGLNRELFWHAMRAFLTAPPLNTVNGSHRTDLDVTLNVR